MTVTIDLTSGTSWTVPDDWDSGNNTILCIGGGGGGSGTNVGTIRAGGGGASAQTSNVSLTPGASITYAIGAAGTAGAIAGNGGNGGDTSFNGGAILADGGLGGTTGAGGLVANSTGTNTICRWYRCRQWCRLLRWWCCRCYRRRFKRRSICGCCRWCR